MSSPLFFMHITKTAGGSLKDAIRRSEADVMFHYNSEPDWRPNFDYDRLPEILFGHYIFGAHERMDQPPRYACFLREPFARTVSHYYHLKHNDNGPVGQRLRTFNTINDYLLEGRHWEFDNFLCRVISGIGNKAKFGDVGFNVYQQARHNLSEYFEFIGIFERMSTSLQRLKAIIPSLDIDLPTVNRGVYDKDIPHQTASLVTALNRYDQLLYEDANTLLAGNPD